jgi:putative membrane protein
MRTPFHFLIITLKGVAMGAADVVPGVSGGTIAFISGIYDELLNSINAVNLDSLKTLFQKGIISFWKQINGSFLLALFSGIIISILSLAKAIEWALHNHPELLWAFFFGLVTASIFMVGKTVKWKVIPILALVFGAVVAYYLTVLPALGDSSNRIFLFGAGFIAICAMILPGISGSFILLLMGAYRPVIEALSNRDWITVGIVAAGCVSGLLVFSRVLKWLLNHYRNVTIAMLTGFLVGSLNKLWPWKEVLQSEIINGKTKVILEKSIAPYGENVNMIVFSAIGGLLLLLGLEIVATKVKR